MLDFSDRTRTGISKLISRCAPKMIDLYLPKIVFFAYLTIFSAQEGDFGKIPSLLGWKKKIIPIFYPRLKIWEEGQNRNKTKVKHSPF